MKPLVGQKPDCIGSFGYINVKEIIENAISGQLACNCGNEIFLIGKSEIAGKYKYLDPIETECIKCKKKGIIFNSKIHGYNGIITKPKNTGIKSADIGVNCTKCNENMFNVYLDFEVAVDDDWLVLKDEYKLNCDYIDIFTWIIIRAKCIECNHEIKIIDMMTC